MNLGSVSKISSARIPKNLTTFSQKSFAIEEVLRALSPTKQGASLQYLVNLSPQVKKALCTLQRGKPVINSILQDTNLPFGIGNGYNKPG